MLIHIVKWMPNTTVQVKMVFNSNIEALGVFSLFFVGEYSLHLQWACWRIERAENKEAQRKRRWGCYKAEYILYNAYWSM